MEGIFFFLCTQFIIPTLKAMKTTRLILAAATVMLLYSCNKNETAPEIADQEFSIAENSPVGTPVGTVVAFDPDEDQTITYEIVDGNMDQAFSITPNDGILQVSNPSALNYETETEHLITVAVSDNHEKDPLESSATIRVLVEDVNEFAPELAAQTFELDENPLPGQLIGKLQYTDQEPQHGISFTLVESDQSVYFSLDEATGELSVKECNAFNYEKAESLQIDVTLSDQHEQPLSTTARITVNINDLTDFEDGILAYYPFNGSPSDESGNELHGVLSEDGGMGPQIDNDRFGNENSAYHFDGIDDYIHLPHPELHFLEQDFSINVWAKTDTETPNGKSHTIFSSYNSSTGKEFKLSYHGAWDTIYFMQYHMGGSEVDMLCLTPESDWHMITVTKSSELIQLYYDGVEIDRMAPSVRVTSQSQTKVMIGAADKSTYHPEWVFDGIIDDLSVHTRVLTASEIEWIFQHKKD